MVNNAYNNLYDTEFRKKLKESPREALEKIDYDFSNIEENAEFVLITSPKNIIYFVMPGNSYIKNVSDLKGIQAGQHIEASSFASMSSAGTVSTLTSSALTVSTIGSIAGSIAPPPPK